MNRKTEYADYFAVRAVHLRRLGYGLCGDWHLAEYLVQHTFLQLYRQWRRIDTTTVDAYARRALVNAYLSHSRSRWRETVFADPPDGSSASPDVAAQMDVRRALVAPPARARWSSCATSRTLRRRGRQLPRGTPAANIAVVEPGRTSCPALQHSWRDTGGHHVRRWEDG